MDKRGIAPILIVIIIIAVMAVGTGGYFLIKKSGTGSSSTSLLIYNNPDTGITIKYPADWINQEKESIVTFASPQESNSDAFQENVIVSVQDLSSKPMTLDEYTKLSVGQIAQMQDSITIESGATIVSGNSGYKVVFTGKINGNSLKLMSVWTVKCNLAYLFTYTAEPDKYLDYAAQVQEMLNSLEIAVSCENTPEIKTQELEKVCDITDWIDNAALYYACVNWCGEHGANADGASLPYTQGRPAQDGCDYDHEIDRELYLGYNWEDCTFIGEKKTILVSPFGTQCIGKDIVCKCYPK